MGGLVWLLLLLAAPTYLGKTLQGPHVLTSGKRTFLSLPVVVVQILFE